MKVLLQCEQCKNKFKGEEPEYCCSGMDCGCQGKPTDPVVCNRRCRKKFWRDVRKAQAEYFDKVQEQQYYEEQAAYEEQWQNEMRATYE